MICRPTSSRNTLVAPLAGAWIEIDLLKEAQKYLEVAPLAGAWIEIKWRYSSFFCWRVAPLAGAWIEMP